MNRKILLLKGKEMKKKIYTIFGVVLLGMVMAACGGTAKTASAGQSPTASGAPGQPDRQGLDFSKMTLPEKLAIGTLKLEGTDMAVDTKEAADLLPLWKAVRSLSTSQTISTKEMDALYSQIEGAMTKDQVKAIEEMSLTRDDISKLMADLGINFGPGQAGNGPQGSNGSAGNRTQGDLPRGGPGMLPGGGPPDSGGFRPGGETGGFEQPLGNRNAQSTPGAGQPPARRGGMGMMFIEPLINLLKQRAGL
jgi:hypothetical protein